ncbi:MAG TPA: hydroxysqualene dehydroxylase HpnE [Candidatus Dormibacteraeota bacterium]|jgi:squalene-associated FAD-dependent desaturase|nr:hydroxysqualene dehydroxylase HpnE [Candidatus Dormibacteraeota bacterium]
MSQPLTQPTVAIAGGGLAGLAAACALSDSGFRVTLFERRPYLGGRASSYEHPGTGEVVDNCQHVLFRVCTNLVEFYRRIGVEDKIRWYEDITFIEPGGRSSVMHASPLPAPLHTAPSFLGFPFLTGKDKLAISRAIAALTLHKQADTGQSFQQWLLRYGQTENAIQRFWKPILVSALSEDLDLISISYAAQVVRESMKSPEARHMGVPSIPLTELYNRAGDYIRARGGEIHFRNSLEAFSPEPERVRVSVGDGEADFDYLVLALPFDGLARVLPENPEATPLRDKLSHFESAPITGIHLWFDRQISDLDHAVLLGRTIQWMFHKSRLLEGRGAEPRAGSNGSYIELVVSASKNLIDKSRSEIVELALKEVREFFPAARTANLVKSTVIKEVHATYSPRPGIDAYRPQQATVWPRVFLAGDWTATGWPATMEGAVRSGYLAAEALTKAAEGKSHRFLAPDLPATGLMRIFH